MKTCETCRWFDRYTKVPAGHKFTGVCRRLPPTPVVHASVTFGTGDTTVWPAWPETKDTHWCGEHAPREGGGDV